jgi:hypothetical protein
VIFGAVLMLLALVPFLGWPLYKKYFSRRASTALIERTKKAVEKHPELKADYDKSMQEGVLTYDKAKEILEKAGETVGPDE